jgi:hypothetical protein
MQDQHALNPLFFSGARASLDLSSHLGTGTGFAKHAGSDRGTPESRLHAAHFNGADLEARAKNVEKSVQGQSLELRFSKQEPREKQGRNGSWKQNSNGWRSASAGKSNMHAKLCYSDTKFLEASYNVWMNLSVCLYH